MLSECTQAWPDFHHMIPGAHRDGPNNGRQNTLIDQEVLPEALASLVFQGSAPARRSALVKADLHKGAVASQRDPLFKRLG